MKAKSVKITLDYPVRLPDGQRTEITIRRPTVGDTIDYPVRGSSDFEGEANLFAALTGWNIEDLRLLDMADYEKLQAQGVSFRKSDPAGKRAAQTGADPVPSDGLEQGEQPGADA